MPCAGGAGGEQAVSRVGAVGAGRGTGQGPVAHRALEGSYRSPAAQRTSAPCAGASCGARAAVTQTWALLAVHQKTHPHLLLDEKKGLQVAFCRCFAFREAFCHSGHS